MAVFSLYLSIYAMRSLSFTSIYGFNLYDKKIFIINFQNKNEKGWGRAFGFNWIGPDSLI
jgi:hypothetical protein